MAAKKKIKISYKCSDCGATALKWMGRCGDCGAWNTMQEVAPPAQGRRSTSKVRRVDPIPVSKVDLKVGEVRLSTSIRELDRVLGGGLVTGGLVLIGGDPGVGKSTLLLTVLSHFSRRGLKTLYVSGEESARQIRLRADRLKLPYDHLHLLAETDLDASLAAAERIKPRALVLDSVQTLFSPELTSVPGSVSQVREVAARAMSLSKGHDIPTFLVGHVTKQGGIAGPKVLEHLVDTVIYFEGDGRTQLRILRAVKNRFGSTGEIGFFEMTAEGLREVPDASARLLAERVSSASGTSVIAAVEGSRPVLAEVQALVGHPSPATPGRTVLGVDRSRLQMHLAVLGKLGFPLHDRDVFVSAAGGLRILEPAADLGIAVSVVGALRDRALDQHTMVFGEVGLVGEIRAVSHPAARLNEAARHGFRRVIAPVSSVEHAPKNLEVVGVRTLQEALAILFGAPKGKSTRR